MLTDPDPERELLLTADELDAMLHTPLMEQWWENTLPKGEVAPREFGDGAPLLTPVDAGVLLAMIAHSCVVLAAPAGDAVRYATTALELDDALARPELPAWQDTVAKLS